MPQVDEIRHFGVEAPFHLEEGTCYLAKGKSTESSYRFARHVIDEGTPLLCVSRMHPERVRSKHGLPGGEIWWISTSPGKDNYNPTAIGTLANAINAFIGSHADGCFVLLDGLEYLALNVGFDKMLLFLEHLNEYVMPRRATLLTPISPECFEPMELARLERFTEAIDEADLRAVLEPHDGNRDLTDS
jgi:two-component system cell cycle response regulator